ncbi:hypothetical protein LTR08_002116 [Meristemomyces frigidus]|nr:hypothetical protein LTR08_002116 [Meristemomyces frigidus]
MALPGGASYFPALDRCLAGHERLISWRTAYRALCDLEIAAENTTLQHFFADEEVISVLCHPLAPFRNATTGHDSTRSRFEGKTAPIQLSQSSHGDYDVEEIKKDALWLSEQLKVDEMVALRIAIVEWQSRAADRLLSGATESEGVVARSSDPRAYFLASTFSAGASSNGRPSVAQEFDGEEARRDRLLRIFGEERDSVIKLSADLVCKYAWSAPDNTSRAPHDWIDELSVKVTEEQCSPRVFKDSQGYLAQCLMVLDKNLDNLSRPCQWPQVYLANPVREDLFATSLLVNLGDELRLVLAQLRAINGPPSPQVVLQWFNMMKREQHKHLQELAGTSALRDVSSIQCLASAVSLAMLQPGETIQYIREAAAATQQPAGVAYPDLREKPYIADNACVEELNTLILLAATEGYEYAVPAIYAWGLIIMSIRDIAVPIGLERQRELEAAADEASSDAETGLRRRPRPTTEAQESQLEKQWELVQLVPAGLPGEARSDPAKFLLTAVVEAMNVYGVIPGISAVLSAAYDGEGLDKTTSLLAREALLALIKDGFEVVPYSGEVLEALFTVLGPSLDPCNHHTDLLPNTFVLDHGEKPYVVDQALQRYPYELSPLLRIMTIVANADSANIDGPPDSVQMLEMLQTATLMVPHDFRAFSLENEEDNTNEMVLTDTLPLFVPKHVSFAGEQRLLMDQAMRSNQEAEDNVFLVSAGTMGYVIREDRPIVLKLVHKHSALEFLGVLLGTLLPTSLVVPAPPTQELDRHTASELLILINALLTAALHQSQGVEEANFVLGRFSNVLPNSQDIITVIADIFEMELLAHLDQAALDGSLDLVIACAEFFGTLVAVSPERVWSVLGRSSLLGTGGGASALAAVVGVAEVHTGHFRFLTACTRLYSGLVEDAIAGLVRRKSRTSSGMRNSRFDSPMQSADSTPERTMRDVLTAYQRIVLDALQSLAGWRFARAEEKQEIAGTLMRTLDGLLQATYGLQAPEVLSTAADQESVKAKDRLASLLMPAAEMVVQGFAPEVSVSPLLDSVAGLLGDGTAVADDLMPTAQRSLVIKQTNATCGLLATLLRTICTTEPKRARALAVELLKNVPVLATLFATDCAYRDALAVLFKEMVVALASDDSVDPPSLLGPLRPEAARSFLGMVSQLDRPLCDNNTEINMWEFLTAVLRGKQQWFAIYLLTGTPPKTRAQDSTTRGDTMQKKSLLTRALDDLSNMALLNPSRAKAQLHFVAVAQKVWAWATVTVRAHADFLQNALAWLELLHTPPRAANNTQALISANEHQMAAHLCDILAVNVHAGLETGDQTVLKMLVPRLGFLAQHAVSVNAYNRSLHNNLAANLAGKFPQCELADFARSEANPARYGHAFRYDVQLAGAMFADKQLRLAWFGNAEQGLRAQGFQAEVERANVNLSLVDAQQRLLASWRTLATTLAESVEREPALQPALVRATEACLRANVEADVEVPGTAEVLQTRAEIAFVLLSKLVGVKAADAGMRGLLPAAWDLVRSSPVDYDVAAAPQDLLYYRTLLQILYLAIRPHCYTPPPPLSPATPAPAENPPPAKPALPAPTAACLLEIVRRTLTPAFRALCANLHATPHLALPADFALVTALLQAVLSVRGIHAHHAQLAQIISASRIARSALSLYSWADKLAARGASDSHGHGDPVYGELAVNFLVALSGIRAVAEELAREGVLAQLASADLSGYFRKVGGSGPWCEPRRMFKMWSEGFVPLCLALLDAVGPGVAGEVAGFLNGFPAQLGRAEEAFRVEGGYGGVGGGVSLGLVREVRGLVMIGLVLRADVARGAAEGLDAGRIPVLGFDLGRARLEVEGLLRSRRGLAERVVATSEREAGWARVTGEGGESVLVGRVVEEVQRTLACFGAG